MSTRTRKLTVEIGGDSKGAINAMDQTEKKAGNLGKSFAGLGKAAFLGIGAIAAGAGAAAVGLFKLGETFDEQFDKIRVGTGKTGDELDALKQSFKDVATSVPASFEDVGTAITDLNQKLGATGKPLEALSAQLLNLSRITDTDLAGNIDAVTRDFKLFGVAGENQTAMLDALFRASQATGASVADLAGEMADASPQLRALGFDFESALTVVAGLGKAGLKTADVLPALSRVLAKGAKDGKSAQKVYQGLIRSIRTAPTDTKAAEIAFDALGAKAGPKFAQIIRSGQFAFDSLGESIFEGTDTINKAAADTADFSEKWQLFKNRILVGLEPLATKVFNSVGTGLDILSAWWAKNGDGIVTWVNEFGTALSESLGPAFDAVVQIIQDKVIPAATAFGDWFVNNKPAVAAFAVVVGVVLVGAMVAYTVSALSAAAATIAATWPVLAAVVAVAALAAGLYYAYKNWGWFHDGVWDAVYAIQTIVGWIGTAIAFLAAMGQAIGNVLGKLDELSDKANPFGGGLLSGLGQKLGVFGVDGARAMGGPVAAGGSYLVGENGPEVFRPSASGWIDPGGSSGDHIVINVTAGHESIASSVARELKRQRLVAAG